MADEGRHGELQRLAKEQWSILKVGQIRAAGFTRHEIRHLVQTAVIHQRFKGIYSYGTDWVPVKGVLLAAQWAVGDDAYLTARSALGLVKVCGLLLSKIQIAVPRQTVRKRKPPIVVSRTDHPPAKLLVDGPLRFAPVEHALLDLSARGASVQEQRRLITEAVHRQRLDHKAMRELLKQHAGRRGVDALAQAYRSYLPRPGAKSGLERSFDTGLSTRPWIPEPLPNHHIEAGGVRWEIDRYWPEYKLGVELHGGGYHHASEDLNKDTFKAVKLKLVGVELMAFTDDRWELEPDACLDDLEQGLALRGWLGRHAA